MGLDLFFPQQLINSMKVKLFFMTWRRAKLSPRYKTSCVGAPVQAATEADPADVSAVRHAEGG